MYFTCHSSPAYAKPIRKAALHIVCSYIPPYMYLTRENRFADTKRESASDFYFMSAFHILCLHIFIIQFIDNDL